MGGRSTLLWHLVSYIVVGVSAGENFLLRQCTTALGFNASSFLIRQVWQPCIEWEFV